MTQASGFTGFCKPVDQIGSTAEDLKSISHGEVIRFYGTLIIIGLLYLLNIMAVGMIHGDLSGSFAAVFVIGFVLPPALCIALSMHSYAKALKPIKDPR
jgi:hypothetical protein